MPDIQRDGLYGRRHQSRNVDDCDGISDELKQALAAAVVAAAIARAAQMSAEELAQASGDPGDHTTQKTPEARAATVARVRADDPAVVKVNWFVAEPTDAEVVALCAALEGNTHVQELRLDSNSKLTEVAFQAVLEAVPKSRLSSSA